MIKIILLHFVALTIQTPAFAQQSYADTIWSENLSRTFRVYVPEIYDGQTPRPLVFNFHDASMTALIMENYTSVFQEIADTANFILVTPDGTASPLYPQFGQIWDNFECCMKVNDVHFVANLIDSLSVAFNIDHQRIYSAGFGNGGFMGYDLACRLNDRIAAVASVAGSMEVARMKICQPGRPTPILEIHGSNDSEVRPNGGYNGFVFYAPLDSVLRLWVRHNQCNATPIVTDLLDINPNDGSRVRHFAWPGCAGGSAVEFLKIIGGAHTWPGAPGANTNQDISAEHKIWQFFNQHRLHSNDNSQAPEPRQPFVWSVTPNPAADFLQVKFSSENAFPKSATLRVFDVSGKTFFHKTLTESELEQAITLDVGGFPAGIYFLSLDVKEGGRAFRRVVVTH